ncbi:MAG: hypothetical protein AB9842_08240 [Bacteroidales bacterium]
MALFSLDELRKDDQKVDGSLILKEKFLDQHLIKAESIKHLNGRLPHPGEVFFIWTLKSFNAFTFIPYIIKQEGKIDELVISSYSISQRILHSLLNYINKGLVCKVEILISESIKFRMPLVQEQLTLLAARKELFTVHYGWNHSKITLMKTQENHFLVEGSGNFAENAQWEQYIFLNSETVFNFRKTCINSSSDADNNG